MEKLQPPFYKKLVSCYSPMKQIIVPSPLTDLTSVFGMGTGVAPSLWTPAKGVFLCFFFSLKKKQKREYDFKEASRPISTDQLNTLLCLHFPPINLLVSKGSSGFPKKSGKTYLEVGFPLRCFQRLSIPNLATLPCRWRDNRYTRDSSIPVLSY